MTHCTTLDRVRAAGPSSLGSLSRALTWQGEGASPVPPLPGSRCPGWGRNPGPGAETEQAGKTSEALCWGSPGSFGMREATGLG